MGRAGPRRPGRRGRTRDPSLATRAALTEPEGRGWAHASGIAATAVRALPLPVRGRGACGGTGTGSRPGRSRLLRYSRVTAASGRLGLQGVEQEGG